MTSGVRPPATWSPIELLEAIPGLNALPQAELSKLAAGMEPCHAAQGEVVIREGEQDDRVFIIVNGSAEVSVSGEWGPRLVAVLQAGQAFGTFAFFQNSGKRTATVTAQSELLLSVLPGWRLRLFLADEPAAAGILQAHAAEHLTANFLTRVGPFVRLAENDRQRLAKRVRSRPVSAGTNIFRQGETGDSCFVVRTGRVTINMEEDGVSRQLGTLGPGEVFGETALLTVSPRNATITAMEDTELLELDRAAFFDVFTTGKEAGPEFVRLMRLRERPRRRPGVLALEQVDPDGSKVTILKDPIRLRYFRLSERGRFVWDRLNGRCSVRELTLDYFRAFREFAPHAVADVVAALAAARFVEVNALVASLDESSSGRLDRWIALAQRCLEWRVTIKGIDGALAALYRRGVWRLYTPAGLAVMFLCAVVGLLCFAAVALRGGTTVGGLGSLAVPMAVGVLVGILAHEAGHAFTTKHFGKTVPYAGAGWYWFTPMVFVDTSDMWLGSRRQRMAVTAAGPCADLVVGSLPAMLAFAMPPGAVSAILWMSAVPFYLSFLLNLNPLLEYDGYYFVSDYLDRPNLRRESLAALRRLVPQLMRRPGLGRGHVLELFYGVGAVLYIALMAGVTLTLCRVALAGWIESVASEQVATALSYLATGAVVLLAGMSVLGDLRTKAADGGTVV